MKSIIIIGMLLVSTSFAQIRYGAILIRDKGGDSLAINADGSLNVSTSAVDTSVVTVYGTASVSAVDTAVVTVYGTASVSAVDTASVIAQDYIQWRKDNGYGFTVGAVDLDIDTGDSLYVSFFVPDTAGRARMRIIASNSVAGSVKIQEGAVSDSAAGSEITIYNVDRNSANVSFITHPNLIDVGKVTSNAGISTAGTTIYYQGLANAAVPVDTYITLKENTEYAVLIVSTAENGVASIILEWDETE